MNQPICNYYIFAIKKSVPVFLAYGQTIKKSQPDALTDQRKEYMAYRGVAATKMS